MPLRPIYFAIVLAAVSSASRVQAAPELVVQQGPTEEPHKVAFAPTGARFALVIGDSIQIWNPESGLLERNLTGSASLASCAWSPDGTQIAAGGGTHETGEWEGKIFIWDAATGRLLRTWRNGTASVTTVAWSPDGKALATAAGGDWLRDASYGATRVWDPVSGKLLRTLDRHYAIRTGLGFSPNGHHLVVSYIADEGFKPCTQIFNWPTGTPVGAVVNDWIPNPQLDAAGKLQKVPGLLTAAPGGRFKVSSIPAGPGTEATVLSVTDPAGKSVSLPLSLPGRVRSIAISEDGSWLVTAEISYDTRIQVPAMRIWRRDSVHHAWQTVRQFERETTYVRSFTCNAATLALSRSDGRVLRWDLKTGLPQPEINDGPYGSRMILSHDGRWLAGNQLWDISGEPPQLGPKITGSEPLAFSADDRYLAHHFGIADLQLKQRAKLDMGSGMYFDLENAAFSPDGHRLAVIDHSFTALTFWSLWPPRPVRLPKLLPNVHWSAVTFLRDGRRLVAAGGMVEAPERGYRRAGERETPLLAQLDAKTGAVLRQIRPVESGKDFITSLALSPDGKILANSDWLDFRGETPAERQKRRRRDALVDAIRFWDADTLAPRGSLPIHATGPIPVNFVTDDVCVVGARGIQFWSVPRRELLATLELLAPADGQGWDWLVTTPDGAFDASPGALPLLRWRVGDQLVSEPPAECPHVPGLLARAIHTSEPAP